MRAILVVLVVLALATSAFGLEPGDIPRSHTNLRVDESGRLYAIGPKGERFDRRDETPKYTLTMVRGNPTGTERGIAFHFTDPKHGVTLGKGRLCFGFIRHGDGRINLPVWFKRVAPIEGGRATIDILANFRGRYDSVGWQKSGRGTLGYRVTDESGRMVYDGKISFTGTGPFRVDTCVVQGPFVCRPLPTSATIAFETNRAAIGVVTIGGREFADTSPTTRHEILVHGLDPNRVHRYTVGTRKGRQVETREFRTPPRPGSRLPFVFAYGSDSRTGQGGGERGMGGVNVYMMKRIAALADREKAAFLQFTGDEIDGYRHSPDWQRLEYANWKRAVEPWAGHLPVIAGMGNHEALLYAFEDGTKYGLQVDRFPYATESAEALFAEAFVNFENGPESEDGAVYDPDPDRADFPSYKENVFSYVWDNVAMVVLNSDYWYAPSIPGKPSLGGNPHGYLMDNQLKWLEETLDRYQRDPRIDHVFVTQHTPAFPNGGHVSDDMWYRGSNVPRPIVAGKRAAKGIIERRDEFWSLLMKSDKVVADLTGDEHNYSRLLLKRGVDIYGSYEPAAGANPIIELFRPVWQINNGAAGAPYYGREATPWSEHLKGFTTQNALVLFRVTGKTVRMEVWNPETLSRVE